MVFVTLAQDDQIVLIDIEDEESEYCNHEEKAQDDIKYCEVINQNEKLSIQLLTIKAKQMKCQIISFLQKIINFPFSLHYYYLIWKQDVVNDFIMVK